MKGAVTLEISFGAEAAKHLMTLAKAGSDLEKVARYEAKYAATKARLAGMRKIDFTELAGLPDDKKRALFSESEARRTAMRAINELRS